MKVGSFAKVCTVGAAIAMFTAGLVAAPAAMADPAGTPALNASTLAGFGSDTTQDVMNALATAINSENSDNAWLASYDALGDRYVTSPKGVTLSPGIARGNGSGEGLTLLKLATGFSSSASVKAGTSSTATTVTSAEAAGNVDFARSSSDRGDANNATNGVFSYVPFAKDAMTMAVNPASSTNGVAALGNVLTKGAAGDTATTASIYSIYHCLARYVYTNDSDGSYNSVGATAGDAPAGTTATEIKPILPKYGSGTRKWFVTNLAGYSADSASLISVANSNTCIVDTVNGSAVNEHDGTAIEETGDGAMGPFSIPQWVSQANTSTTGVTDKRHSVILLGATASAVAHDPLSAGATNTSFPFTRTVFNVVPFKKVRVSTSREYAIFNGANSASAVNICAHSSVISELGFIPLNVTETPSSNADCGYIGNRWGAPSGAAGAAPTVTAEFAQIAAGDTFDVSVTGDNIGGAANVYSDSAKTHVLAANIDVPLEDEIGFGSVTPSEDDFPAGSTLSLYGTYNPSSVLAVESGVSAATNVKVVNPYVVTLGDVPARVKPNTSVTISAAITPAVTNPGAKVGGIVTLYNGSTVISSTYMVKRASSVSFAWKPTVAGAYDLNVVFEPDNSSESLNGSDSADVTVNTNVPTLTLTPSGLGTAANGFDGAIADSSTSSKSVRVNLTKVGVFPTGTVKVLISTSRTGGTMLKGATATLVNGVATVTLPAMSKWHVTGTSNGVTRYLNVIYSGDGKFFTASKSLKIKITN